MVGAGVERGQGNHCPQMFPQLSSTQTASLRPPGGRLSDPLPTRPGLNTPWPCTFSPGLALPAILETVLLSAEIMCNCL